MKKFLILLAFAAVMTLCSCSETVKNEADEIRLNSWRASLAGNRSVSLSFEGDTGCFQISSKEKSDSVTLKGLTLFDKNSFALFDREDKMTYRFNYSLKENKLRLSCDYGALTLKRN